MNEIQIHNRQTVAEIRASINLIQEVMASCMKKDVHYGTIPGTNKPTLYKAGSEKILSTFRIAVELDVEDLSTNDSFRYRVKARGVLPTGEVVGCGIGECSTDEEKYRWRGAVSDKEFDATPEDRKRIKYTKIYKPSDSGEIRQIRTNPADLANCVTPDTLILTHDLQWVPAGELVTGDVLLGVEEEPESSYARHFSTGEATVHGLRVDELFEITFADGRTVKCNGEHKWLVKKIGLKGTEWVSTEDICKEMSKQIGRPRKWTVMSVGAPWQEDKSKNAGYLAGLLDADGTLGIGAVIVKFAQQDNCVLAAVEQGISSMGFATGKSACKSESKLNETINGRQVYALSVGGGLFAQMRLLGTLRPPRLIERWLTLVNINQRRLEGPGSGSGRPQEIVAIEKIGQGEVVMLSTSCLTYIANGLVCHNTVLKMAKKRAQIDLTLTATAASDVFEQDIEDLPTEYVDGMRNEQQPGGKPEVKPPQSKSQSDDGKKATESQVKLLEVKLKKANVDREAFKAHFGIAHLADIPMSNVNDAIKAIDSGDIKVVKETLPTICNDCGQPIDSAGKCACEEREPGAEG